MISRSIAVAITVVALGLSLPAALPAQTTAAHTQPATPAAFATLVAGHETIGDGPLLAYRGKDQTLVSIPIAALDRLYFWYVEAARFPEAAIALHGNSVAEAVVTLERQGSRLLIPVIFSTSVSTYHGSGTQPGNGRASPCSA